MGVDVGKIDLDGDFDPTQYDQAMEVSDLRCVFVCMRARARV